MTVSEPAIQARVTITGFALTLFIFTAMLVVNFSATSQHLHKFGAIYFNTILPLCLGFVFSLAALCIFLSLRDEVGGQPPRVLGTGSAWAFCIAELLIYLSLAEFLSSGMNNFLYEFREALKEFDALCGKLHYSVYSLAMLGVAPISWTPDRLGE